MIARRVGISLLLIANIGLRIAWQTWPGLPTALALWLVAGSWLGLLYLDNQRLCRRLGLGMMLLGLSLNGLVTLANGGFMPVPNGSGSDCHSVWRCGPANGRLLFLADQYAGFSLGDFLLLSGVLLYLLTWWWPKR